MFDYSISYRQNGKDLHAEILAPCTEDISEATKSAQMAFIKETASALIPQMNKDILSEGAGTAVNRPLSYRQFSALQKLACKIDGSDKCPADWGRAFKKAVCSPDGQEPLPGQMGSFVLDYHSVSVRVDYEPDWCSVIDHLTLRSISPEKQPLPVSDTGFKSHFLNRADIVSAGGVQSWVIAFLDWGAKENESWGQQSLF